MLLSDSEYDLKSGLKIFLFNMVKVFYLAQLTLLPAPLKLCKLRYTNWIIILILTPLVQDGSRGLY